MQTVCCYDCHFFICTNHGCVLPRTRSKTNNGCNAWNFVSHPYFLFGLSFAFEHIFTKFAFIIYLGYCYHNHKIQSVINRFICLADSKPQCSYVQYKSSCSHSDIFIQFFSLINPIFLSDFPSLHTPHKSMGKMPECTCLFESSIRSCEETPHSSP